MWALQILLEVRRTETESFRSFETACVRVMAKHGGKLVSAIEIEGESDDVFFETHVVTFDDEAAFGRYLADPEREALRGLRERSILATTVVRGKLVEY